jgi:hypothetical protein
LFSDHYKSLFPQRLSFHIYTKRPGVAPKTLLARPGIMSKMPPMQPSSPLRPLAVCFAALVIFLSAMNWSSAFAQTPLVQPRPAIIVSGTVRDSAGAPIADASVFFEEKGTSASIDAKTAADGTFSFLALRPGTYLVRARKDGLREVVTGPWELALGQKKQLDLVLTIAKPSVHAKKQSKVNLP